MMKLSGRQRRVLVAFLLSKVPSADAVAGLESMLSVSEIPNTSQIRRRADPFGFALSIVEHCEAYGEGPAGSALEQLLSAVEEVFGGTVPDEVRRLSAALLEAPRPRPAVAAEGTPQADVFICYNSQDHVAVTEIASALEQDGTRVWTDRSALRGGDVYAEAIAAAIATAKFGVVCCGKHGLGRWQALEIRALLRAHAERGTRIVPVVLADAPPGAVSWTDMLNDFHFIDLRTKTQERLQALRGVVRAD